MSRSGALLAAVLILAVTPVAARAQAEPEFRDRKLSEWLSDLRFDRDQRTREVAPLVLGFAATHPPLWRAQTNRRRAALLALEAIGPEKSRLILPALVDTMREDPDDSVRAAAAGTLGRLAARPKADPEIFVTPANGLLLALKKDKEKSNRVREAAVEALGKMTAVPGLSGDAVPALADILKNDPEQDLRRAAAEALRRWGKASLLALKDLEAAVARQDNDEATRTLAIRAIGAIGPPEALDTVKTLRTVLVDAKAPTDLRVAVVEVFGILQSQQDNLVEVLGQLLVAADTPAPVRQELAVTLGKYGAAAKPALPDLRKAAVAEPNKDVRCQVFYAFARIGKDLGADAEPVTMLLLAALKDPNLDVRLAAIQTLGALGPETLGANLEEVRKRLMEQTKDSSQDVREAAQAALKKLVKP
jgi:HEAT repeat protein